MIQDRTSLFPKAFIELTLGLSDALKVAFFTILNFFTTNEARKITDSISCHSKNLINLIECKKCHRRPPRPV